MTFGFLNILMLLGLVSVAIPPIIHLLSRRRYEVIDWGAMQFLRISETTRRRLFIEELLLMLLRMGLIAILVLAMAAPVAFSPLFSRFGMRENRDVVLIFDGSTSMGYSASGQSPQEAAQKWAREFVNDLAPGDSVAVLQARQQVVPVLGEPTHDLERVRDAIEKLAPPRGNANWPEAVQAATQILQPSQRPTREIILLGDGHRAGLTDEASLRRWEMLAQQFQGDAAARPRLWYVNLDPKRTDNPNNWSVARIRRASRAVTTEGRETTFRTSIHLRGDLEYQPAHNLRLKVDGQTVPQFKPQVDGGPKNGQISLAFEHRFLTVGSHLMSVELEPDRPPSERPANYQVKDHLAADNRRDFVVEVLPPLPVLLVEGPPLQDKKLVGARALVAALSPERDPHPAAKTTVKPYQQFDPTRDLTGKNRPRVLILANVPELTQDQQDGVTRFLDEGGGVLVTLGERINARSYNEQLYRGGVGWLPARLDSKQEAEPVRASDIGTEETTPHPLPSTFNHPSLELLRHEDSSLGLGRVRFLRWWKVTLPSLPDKSGESASVAVAHLTNNDPFLVERPTGKGRVVLCTVPLDDSWSPNLLSQFEYPMLAHELMTYLAGARGGEFNLLPGQPLQYQPLDDEPPGSVNLQPPHGDAKTLKVERWPLTYTDTREPGVYRLTTSAGKTVYYVVEPDPSESELAPSTETERKKVSELIPLTYQDSQDEILFGSGKEAELWWWFLFGVIGLLCCEVWMTRRMALRSST